MPDAPTTPPPRLPVVAVGLATLLSVTAALLIALRQLDGLVGQVLDGGVSRTPTQLTGPGLPWAEPDGWRFLFGAGLRQEGGLGGWLTGYAVLDVLFALAYGSLLLTWAGALTLRLSAHRVVVPALLVGIGADLVESALILLRWADPLPWVSAAKWVGLACAVVLLVAGSRGAIAAGVRHLALGLYTHRYSAVIVLPLALLGLAAGPDLLEQVPDIQRRWTDPDETWQGVRHFAAAGVVTLLLTVAAFATGRQRSDHLYRRTQARLPLPTEPRSPLLLWFVGPALLAVGAVVAWTHDAHVAVWPLLIFGGTPLLIGGGSGWIRRQLRPDPASRRKRRPTVSHDRFASAVLVGDLLAGALVVVAGLGAIRSFTAVVALGADWRAWSFLALGCLTVLGAWWGYGAVLARLATAAATAEPPRLVVLLTPGLTPEPAVSPADSERKESRASLRNQWVAWVVLVGSLAVGLWLALWPRWATEVLGVIATFQLAVGALSLLIAATVILLSPGGAPEVFWKGSPLASSFVPVTTLVVGACLCAALFAGNTEVHGLRAYPAAEGDDAPAQLDPEERPGIAALFDDWVASGHREECLIETGDGLSIRPLLLYAAEGGGIRAAYWTASGVDKVYRDVGADECGGAFLSSGASGGAVGLSVASVVPAGAARDAVRDISGPDPLSAAVDGLVLRDTVYAATGVPLPPYRSREDDGHVWVDRAGLIEEAWEREVGALADPWLEPHATWDWPASGPMVLNSTSATTGCRALLSQVSLGEFDDVGCTDRPAVAGSSDLLACTGQLRTSTVALLASRFPYVTPSAAQRCGTDQQFVDGGYAENTGIGTLVDLAPQVLAEVRRHNDCVLGSGEPSECADAATTLVVPLLLYFDNGTGADLLRPPPKPALELLVPPLTAWKAGKSLYSADSQLQRARDAFATTQLWAATGAKATAAGLAVDRWRRCGPVYVMYQRTSPGIAAPLGWVLSKASREPMDHALTEQGRTLQRKLPYGTIEELVDRLRLPELAPAGQGDPCPGS